MKLDDKEQAMMDEIQLDFSKPRTHAPPTAQRMFRQPPPEAANFQEDVDAFANSTKQSAPPPPQMEDPIDHGEYSEPPQYEGGGLDYGQMEPQEEQPSPGYKTIDEEKSDLVNKLGRLEIVDSTSINA